MKLQLLAVLPLPLLPSCVGCRSISPYMSPRIEGRVVDEATRQPISSVAVRRGPPKARSSSPSKGGQDLKAPAPVRSETDGTFILNSQRVLVFLRRARWYSVTLSFSHAGYEPLTRTYNLNDSTNTPAGEPL